MISLVTPLGTKFHHMKGQIKCIGQDGTTYSYQFTDEIPQEVNTYHHHAITVCMLIM